MFLIIIKYVPYSLQHTYHLQIIKFDLYVDDGYNLQSISSWIVFYRV